EQLSVIDWGGDVVVRPCIERADTIFDLAVGADHEDGCQAPLGPQLAHSINSILAEPAAVDDDQVVFRRLRVSDELAHRCYDVDPVARGTQCPSHRCRRPRVGPGNKHPHAQNQCLYRRARLKDYTFKSPSIGPRSCCVSSLSARAPRSESPCWRERATPGGRARASLGGRLEARRHTPMGAAVEGSLRPSLTGVSSLKICPELACKRAGVKTICEDKGF